MPAMTDYDPSADPVHGSGWNSAARWGGWHWEEPRGAEHFRRCSFCGGISPDDLAAETAGIGCGFPGCPEPRNELAPCHFPVSGTVDDAGRHRFVNTGWRASWADRKYGWPHKFYVEGLVNRHPQVKRIITACSEQQYQEMLGGSSWPFGKESYEWHRIDDVPAGYDTSGWRIEDAETRERYQWLGFGSDNTHHAKFYTIHLADPAVSSGVKDTISRVCGLRFTFEGGGTVRWQAT